MEAAPPAGPAVTGLRLAEHLRPLLRGDHGAAIAAAIVHHPDAAQPLLVQLADHMGDRLLFIAHRDHHLQAVEQIPGGLGLRLRLRLG